jgi:hypothetical protein
MKDYSVRIFNEDGLVEFERVLQELKLSNLKSIPEELLFNESLSYPLEPIVNIEQLEKQSKNELIPYLVSKLDLRNRKGLYFNKGLWTWLTAFFFESICPQDGNGKRKINENAFYILKDPRNYTKYYRHLLAYPSRVFSEIGDASRIFLVGSFAKRGEITEQFGAYQQIALNKGIIEAANILYWNSEQSNIKRGAASKGAGSARRFVKIIGQYQMTYDLNSMNGNEIADLLPNEFAKWR